MKLDLRKVQENDTYTIKFYGGYAGLEVIYHCDGCTFNRVLHCGTLSLFPEFKSVLTRKEFKKLLSQIDEKYVTYSYMKRY